MHSQLKEHTEQPRHRDTVKAWAEYNDVCAGKKTSIATAITNNRTAKVNENRAQVKTLLRATGYLGRQGLPFRGQDEGKESNNRGKFCELTDVFGEWNEHMDIIHQRRVRMISSQCLGTKLLRQLLTKSKRPSFMHC